jgi:hypothetical protein
MCFPKSYNFMHKLPSPAEAFANAYRALRAAGKSVEHSERIAWAASSMARARALGASTGRKCERCK